MKDYTLIIKGRGLFFNEKALQSFTRETYHTPLSQPWEKSRGGAPPSMLDTSSPIRIGLKIRHETLISERLLKHVFKILKNRPFLVFFNHFYFATEQFF